MKCNRQQPCESCSKRGLASLCLANGTLRPGKGTRYILSTTEELHARIDQLLERSRDLEVALDASHGLHSTQTHGLLKKEMLVEGSRLALEKEHDEEEEVPVAAFGTLKISQKTGGAEWIGSTASSYFFVQDEDAVSVASSAETLPENDAMLREMLGSLPTKAEAWSLLESYHENFTWNYNLIPRTVLIRDFLAPTYDPSQPRPSLQHLSVLFSMFSIGTLMDLSRVPNSAESKMYRDVAKIPLDVESLSKDTSLTTIEALIMYAQAIQWSDDPNGPALTWTYLSLCVTLGESIGLHRDPKSTWDMDDATTLRRRRVFWEMLYMVTWQSLIHGRPPLLTQRHIDIQLPEEETEETMGTNPAFHLWRYRWTKDLGWLTADQLLAPAYPPTHALVMKIDKKIREVSFPWDVNFRPNTDEDDQNVLKDMQSMMMNGILELNSLHVHRGFFAHALFQSPTDPLQSKFAASVYSAFGAACRVIQRSHDYHTRRPMVMRRSSIMYSHTFSAAIIVGAIATQAPQCSLATAALHELDTAYAIFRNGKDNIRVSKILYVVTRLQAKARESFQAKASGVLRGPEPPSDLPGIIGAQTVVKQNGSSRSSRSPPGDSPPSQMPIYDTSPPRKRDTLMKETPLPLIPMAIPPESEYEEPRTPQYNSHALPEEYWYPAPQDQHMSHISAPHHMGQHQRTEAPQATQHSGYVPQVPPEMYMQPSRLPDTHQHDEYAWQRQMQAQNLAHAQSRSSIMAPNRYSDQPQQPQLQSQPQPQRHQQQHPQIAQQYEAYIASPIRHGQYHQYSSSQVSHHHPQPHPQAPMHGQHPVPDNHGVVVAPDQSWSIFLGKMGI